MHKHLPEITKDILCYRMNPILAPKLVGNFKQGMLLQIPLFKAIQQIKKLDWNRIQNCNTKSTTKTSSLSFAEMNDETLLQDGFLNPCLCNHSKPA